MTDGRWSPEDAYWGYRQFWREELRRIQSEEALIVDLLGSLNAVRSALLDRVAFASKTWDIRTAQMMLSEIERLMGYWAAVQTTDLVRAMEQAWDSGASQTTGVLYAAGLQVSVAPFISRTMLDLATRTVPVLVTGITKDVSAALGRELRRSVMAEEGPLQFMQRIGGPLPLTPAGDGPAIQTGPFAGMAASPGVYQPPPRLRLPATGTFPTAYHRAEAIYRTEIGRLASMANQATLGEVARLVPGMQKRWSSILDPRSRPEHKAAHGQTVAWDQPFTVGYEELMYPRDPRGSAGNVINCFPGDTLVSGASVEAGYRRWYEGELVEIATASGLHLAGTPNHPVLTRGGWAPLGSLQEGDEVIGRRVGDLVRPVEPQVVDVPAPIEQVFGSLTEMGLSHRVVGSTVDFHGDGSDREVEVVRVNSLLGRGAYPSGAEQVGNDGLDRLLDAPGMLQSQGPGVAPGGDGGDGVSLAPAGSVGLGGQLTALVGTHPTHPDRVGLPDPADWDAMGEQESANRGAADAEALRDGLLRLPFEVGPDQVVSVERRQFAGHVYNLQTVSGWYIGNGIVVHNCRCASLPWNDAWLAFGAKPPEHDAFRPWLPDSEYQSQ